HHANRFARRDETVEWPARHGIADYSKRQAAIGRRAVRAIGDNRIAVHRDTIESRHVDIAGNGVCEHPARGSPPLKILRGQVLKLSSQPFQGGLDGVTLCESSHPDVFCCSSYGVPRAHRTLFHRNSCASTGLISLLSSPAVEELQEGCGSPPR